MVKWELMSATEYEVVQGAAWIRLNRPDNRNALSTELVIELYQHLRAAEQDEQVREWGTNSGRLLRVDDGVDRYTGQPRMGNVPVNVRAATSR